MSDLVDLLGYDFVRHAVLAALLASVLCGLVGTFVVVKRLVFISGGLAHAAFAGLGFCYWAGLDPRLGAAAVGLVLAVALGLAGRERVRSHDALIGIAWAVGMAIGILFVSRTPGYAPNLMTYLFGNILAVGLSDVLLNAALAATVLTLVVLFYKELVAVAFDEEFAAVQGVPVRAFSVLLLVLISLSIVFLIQLVGVVLVIALLTIPPLAGLGLVRSFVGVMVVATLLGLVMTLAGLAISFHFDLPTGPSIVLLGALLLGLSRALPALAHRFRRHS